jgi:hypothetical protein
MLKKPASYVLASSLAAALLANFLSILNPWPYGYKITKEQGQCHYPRAGSNEQMCDVTSG